VKRREFLQAGAVLAAAAQTGPAQTSAAGAERFLATAESLKPKLGEIVLKPASLVQPAADPAAFLQWRMEPGGPVSELAGRTLHHGDSFILDFGTHLTGHLAFSLAGIGSAVDSPVRLKLIFGEVPGDVAVPLETYKGALSRAWLPDEIVNVDFLPQRVRIPRRHAFRYVKFEVIDTSPNFGARFTNFEATAVSSAGEPPAPLASSVPQLLRRIDNVSLWTLRDCMQTVFEDGPRRDRRLWVGDLRLQALTNAVTYRNFDLVKRCLYLFAGLPREDGLVAACVYDEPKALCGRQYIMDYSALYAATVLDYVRATNDLAAARELWPVVRRQMEILSQFINRDGLFVDPKDWWLFIDWNDALDRTAPMQGVLLYCYRQALELARLAGADADVADYPERIRRMTAAARSAFYDPARRLFVSGPAKQASWASQAWMIHSGVASAEEGRAALQAVAAAPDAVRPITPYLYHYVVDAMLACGMKDQALALIQSYWGGMVQAGADTFWEVYNPAEPLLSPYGSVLVNSYCHAWSCTPAWFLRGRGLV
jgi:alpha-L-rhamnosidase